MQTHHNRQGDANVKINPLALDDAGLPSTEVYVHDSAAKTPASLGRTQLLLALALGSFVIDTSEFASMGIPQLFSSSLGLTVAAMGSEIPGRAQVAD